MAIKKTLLEIVQSILNDMDSQQVNALSDTLEAQQVASIVEGVYYQIISSNNMPEHRELIKLTALSDTTKPTYFTYPTNVKSLSTVWYNTASSGDAVYSEIDWKEPEEFLYLTDRVSSNYLVVSDVHAGTSFRIQNDIMPSFYTSFDDEHIVMNSYDSSIDTTLQESKTRSFGYVFPVFDKTTDTYVPDIDGVMFPYLISEAKSTAMSVLKGSPDIKVEKHARQQAAFVQSQRYNTERSNSRNGYGR